MSQVPPVVPPTLNYSTPPPPADLRMVAIRQKGVIFCILAYLLAVIGRFITPPELAPLLGIFMLGVWIATIVFAFMLALTIYKTATGIILGLLTLIPLVGLIVLLVINGKATGILRQHRIQVGLLGANLSQIPSPGQIPVG